MTYAVKRKPGLLKRLRGSVARRLAGDQRPRYDVVAQTGDGGLVLLASGAYRGGEVTRLNKSWQPDLLSGDAAISEGWDLLVRRVRDLRRNDPAVLALDRALLDHVIGCGIGTTAAAKIDGELDDEFNSEADEQFDWWADQEADLERKQSWHEMQRQLFSEMNDAGEVLLLASYDPDPSRSVPLCYQVLEAEQIDSSKERPGGPRQNRIRRGIELDHVGRAVAYWLHDVHPGERNTGYGRSIRVPASRVLHLMRPGRPSQTRGMSNFEAITQSARDLDNYLGAELTTANIGALFTLVHKTEQPGAGFGFVGDGSDTTGSDDHGNALSKLGRGIIAQVGLKDEIEQVEAKRPNRDARVFTDLIMLLMAMGGNVSPYRMTRDYTGTTYVAARAAHLDDRAAFKPLKSHFARRVCVPVRQAWTAQAIALNQIGGVSSAQFQAARRRWLALKLQLGGWEQIDPEKETDADLAAISAGLTTLEEVCSRRGLNWKTVILQRKREVEFAAQHGVTLNYDRPSTPGKRQESGVRDQESVGEED